MGWLGLEPRTNALKGRCSTIELPTRETSSCRIGASFSFYDDSLHSRNQANELSSGHFVCPGTTPPQAMRSPYNNSREVAQRVLRPIEMENLQTRGTGGRPISLRVVARVQDFVRGKSR